MESKKIESKKTELVKDDLFIVIRDGYIKENNTFIEIEQNKGIIFKAILVQGKAVVAEQLTPNACGYIGPRRILSLETLSIQIVTNDFLQTYLSDK